METTEALAFNIHIIVLWNEAEVTVSVVKKIDKCIHYQVCIMDGKLDTFFTMIYAANSCCMIQKLWTYLLLFNQVIHKPWAVLGDLNFVLAADEKRLEDGEVTSVSTELSNFLGEEELEDFSYFEQKFTWCNHHTGCKLDTVLVNDLWLSTCEDSFSEI